MAVNQPNAPRPPPRRRAALRRSGQGARPVVRGRDEPGLERGRRQVDPGIEHAVEERRERRGGLAAGLVVVVT